MDELPPQRPWYNRPLQTRFPIWLLVCVLGGGGLALALEAAGIVADWRGRGLAFATGFGLFLVILSFIRVPDDQPTSLLPPRWVRGPVISAVVAFGIYLWFEKQARVAAPANVAAPTHALVMLWIAGGWFGLRLLYLFVDVLRAVRTGGDLSRIPAWTLGGSILAGGMAGYAIVVVLWPEVQFGLRRFIAWLAVVPGLVVGVVLDFYLSLRRMRLLGWLLSWRLPHYRGQLRSPDERERLQAAKALFRMCWHAQPALPDLLDALKDSSADVRAHAALALWSSQVKDAAAPAAVRPLLRDADERVRIAAAAILFQQGVAAPTEILPPLIAGLMHADGQYAEALACATLVQLGADALPALSELRRALWERQPPNVSALDAFAEMGGDGIPLLAEALTHPDPFCRSWAAKLLGDKGPAAMSALPALESACKDDKESVRQAADKALKQIRSGNGSAHKQ